MDKIDREILGILQKDSTLSLAQIAERVDLSPTPTWNRIQKLEESGVIKQRVALLDHEKINAGVMVFVSVRTNQHEKTWLDQFANAVSSFPEVVEFYRMSGDVDYLLKVAVPDIKAYDRFYQQLIAKVDLYDVKSSFAMEQIKYTTALPLNFTK